MAKSKTYKAGRLGLRFSNWPEQKAAEPLSDVSLVVVRKFLAILRPSNSARAAALKITADEIEIIRRIPKASAEDPLTVHLNLLGEKATEAHLAAALVQTEAQIHLRQLVDAARGNEALDAKFAAQMVASAVCRQAMGVFL